jgi:hypothetical protein
MLSARARPDFELRLRVLAERVDRLNRAQS